MSERKKKPYEIGDLDQYLFGQGNHYDLYKKMGAHLVSDGKKKGVYFAVWAPHAEAVSVVGDFNGWEIEANPMEREEPLGIYTCFIPGLEENTLYKYCIKTYTGEHIFKADPFANYAELRPGTASRVTDIEHLKWTDTQWMEKRKTWKHEQEPMSIYEVHIGSWKRHPGREDEGFYSYREFAKEIVKYVKDMGYTHIEIIGIAEHPFDGSWGYQMCIRDRGTLYEIVTAVDLEKPQVTRSSRAIFSKGGDLYVSSENIYYYETVWTEKGQREMTTIRKISYQDGELEPEAQGTVDGYINDSFSIDEYEGRLRIVTTVVDTNSVTVLDEELQTMGEITGLAKDERIYSARFLGEVGYFVTFRETDPLFSVDFSDPDKPRIIGKLKIPGFSDYLHSYREGQLLGIGMDVDEKTQITGGVKLTMFDVTDPADVKEADTYVLENVYNTDVSYDYKAALVDGEKDLIGFPADSEGGRIYYLFSYDTETGFQRLMEEEVNGGGWATRGIYIGDRLYVVDGNVIEAYSLEDYEKLDGLIL